MLNNAKNGTVRILPGVFRERMDVNRRYLMELDTNCLPGLQVVDDPATANIHWGSNKRTSAFPPDKECL